jgi:hypothetical protein
MHKSLPYVVSAAVVLLAIVAVAAQNGTAQVIGGDEAALRELLARSLASYPAYEGSESTVHVGSLPDNLPFELNLPDDTQVIGSVQRGESSPTEIFIDVPQSPENVITFFEESFSGDDWRLVDGFPGGGFTTMPSDSAFYCSETFDALVNISAFGYGDAMSDTRLYVSPAEPYLCSEADGSVTQDPYRLLPQLQTPEGVTLLQGGGGGGGSGPGFQSVSTQAYLLSDDLSLSDIMDAYNEQLEAFGWQPVGQESGDKLGWSGWTVASDGKTWNGILTLTAHPTAPDQYTATLMILETQEE